MNKYDKIIISTLNDAQNFIRETKIRSELESRQRFELLEKIDEAKKLLAISKHENNQQTFLFDSKTELKISIDK